eukprot:SAG31_NODE_4411_length_3255_cov_1.311787_2_plen_350_part_00
MHDPVLAMDGHSYEAAMIVHWLRDNQTSPITNQVMPSKLLVRNLSLRNAMHEWVDLQLQQSNAVRHHHQRDDSGNPEDNGESDEYETDELTGEEESYESETGNEESDDDEAEDQNHTDPANEESAERLMPHLPSQLSAGAPIVFEATNARTGVPVAAVDSDLRRSRRRGWSVVACGMFFAMLMGCYLTIMHQPWQQNGGSNGYGPHNVPPSPPPRPPGPQPPQPPPEPPPHPGKRPWESWREPTADSLPAQLFTWEKWEPIKIHTQRGDAQFHKVTFKPHVLPSRAPATRRHNSSDDFFRMVYWYESRSQLDACPTDKKTSCLHYKLALQTIAINDTARHPVVRNSTAI